MFVGHLYLSGRKDGRPAFMGTDYIFQATECGLEDQTTKLRNAAQANGIEVMHVHATTETFRTCPDCTALRSWADYLSVPLPWAHDAEVRP